MNLQPETKPCLADYPDALTVDEVVSILRVSRKTVYEQIKTGHIKSVKVGRSHRIVFKFNALLLGIIIHSLEPGFYPRRKLPQRKGKRRKYRKSKSSLCRKGTGSFNRETSPSLQHGK